MRSKEIIKPLFLILLSFTAYCCLLPYFKIIKSNLDKITDQGLTSYILAYLIVGIPIFLGIYFLDRKLTIFRSLGLTGNFFKALGISLVFTLPMFIGGMCFFRFNPVLQIENLIAGTIVAGVMEELYYRGFLFGQLFKKTSLGFIPSIFLGAVLFALGHVYQSPHLSEMIGIFIITFLGAVLFAWLYVEWNFNLWVSIFTHTFMNLSWALFEIDSTALGGLKANIFRGLTILIAIVFTIFYKRRKKQNLRINKNTLILKKSAPSYQYTESR